MNTSLESKISILIDRAQMLFCARQFFSERHILEVDTPLLSRSAPVDAHIDVMSLTLPDGARGYLHTSPEYAMKRLLSSGIGDIYQLSHVFREGEVGLLHNPEFTMVEWYRLGFTFEQMMHETETFIQLFLGDLPIQRLSYREAFFTHTGLDYLEATEEELLKCASPLHLSPEARSDKDTLLQALMSFVVEPQLGRSGLTTLFHYPASQSALAKTALHGKEPIALRFEVYSQGIELANGYHELSCAKEQRRRIQESHAKRAQLGKPPLETDERFLAALEQGIPDCCGVAVGFDRLMLLRHKKQALAEILPLSWTDV